MQQASAKAGKKAIVVYGDEQAAAVAETLRRIAPVNDRFTIKHIDGVNSVAAEVPSGATFFEQITGDESHAPAGIRCVRFPLLELKSLWPFTRQNEHNRPDPPEFPAGRFPYRDVFITTCIRKQLAPEEIIQLYLTPEWGPEAWPDVDAMFASEHEELRRRDSLCDVPLSDYVFEHFRALRLFVAPQSPTNLLLAELIRRLLVAAFPRAMWVGKADVAGALALLGERDILGALAVPIHKRVAEHFGLKWYDRNDVYNYFDRKQMRDVEYYRALLIDATDGRA